MCGKVVGGTILVGAALGLLALPGCDKHAPTSAKQTADKATAAVEKMLDAWTRGESLDKFATANPSIQAVEPDWQAGHRLLSFLTSDARSIEDQAGLVQCRVALSLQDRAGKKVNKNATYQVQVGDAIRIERTAKN